MTQIFKKADILSWRMYRKYINGVWFNQEELLNYLVEKILILEDRIKNFEER